jgi:hypothetical protein
MIAYHEAGHAVCAYVQGLKIHKATIVPDGIVAGSLWHNGLARGAREWIESGGTGRLGWAALDAATQCRIEKQVRVCLAGEIAQRRFNPHSVRRHHSGGDYQNANRLLDGICGTDGERRAYFKLLRLQAERLVDLHWHMVEATATALLAKKTLDGKAIFEAIRHASSVEFKKLALLK